MDFLIVGLSFFTFIIFLITHIVVLRRINKQAVIKWIVYIYVLAFMTTSVVVVAFNSSTIGGAPSGHPRGVLTFFGLSLILYTLMVFIYVMGFLGVMMTSVRIRLLGLIAAEGEKIGISTANILKQYNKKVIIKNRLSRLLASGDLRLHDGNYSLGRRFSYFYFHNWITSLFRRLYD